jgi:hypothetical protein
MGAQLAGFMVDAVGHLNAVESALLTADESDARAQACDRLDLLRDAAASLAFARMTRIASAAVLLLARGREARPFVFRAVTRLRDILGAVARTGTEPSGEDDDLTAAAEKLPPLSDTLARARDRLLEISPTERDPRLGALIARLIALGAELEMLEPGDAEAGAHGAPRDRPSCAGRRP